MAALIVQSPAISFISFVRNVIEAAEVLFGDALIDYRDYGLIKTILLHTAFPQAQSVISRVRKYVIARPEDTDQACLIKDSYATSFNMIAVAVSESCCPDKNVA